MRYLDFPETKKTYLISQRLPIIQKIYRNSVIPLFRVRVGNSIGTIGYLEPIITTKLLLAKVKKWEEKFRINLRDGFNVYKFFAETSKIDTKVLIVSPTNMKPSTKFPNELKLMRLGDMRDSIVFYLTDYEATTLSLSDTDFDFPLLNHKRIIKSLSEISNLSMEKRDVHISNSILSSYIGTDFKRESVDGIGSSYLSKIKLKKDLMKIDEILKNEKFGISFSHFGILNHFDGNIFDIMNLRRESFGKFKTVSWNVPSDTTMRNVKLSEFKYSFDNELLRNYRLRDLENNLEFHHSLLQYAIKDKRITSELYGELVVTASKEIGQWLENKDSNLIFKIIDLKNMNEQVGRIASYFSTYGIGDKEMKKQITETISHNIGDILTEKQFQVMSKDKARTKGAERIERELDPKIRIAFYSSDRTKQNIIEKFMEHLGCSEKKAEEVFGKLENGIIFTPDDVHYRWWNESQFKFK